MAIHPRQSIVTDARWLPLPSSSCGPTIPAGPLPAACPTSPAGSCTHPDQGLSEQRLLPNLEFPIETPTSHDISCDIIKTPKLGFSKTGRNSCYLDGEIVHIVHSPAQTGGRISVAPFPPVSVCQINSTINQRVFLTILRSASHSSGGLLVCSIAWQFGQTGTKSFFGLTS